MALQKFELRVVDIVVVRIIVALDEPMFVSGYWFYGN